MRGLCVVVVASGVVACSLLTNLDDLRDGGASDVAVDVAADASADSPGDGAPSGTFCSQVDATFCDDFEEDGSFTPLWTTVDLRASGTVTRAVHDSGCIAVAVGAGDAGPNAYLNKAFITSTSKIHYAFDLQVATYASSSGGTVNTAQIGLPLADGGGLISGYVYLAISPASSRLVEQHHFIDGGFSAQVSALFASPTLGTWYHVDVVVDLAAGTSSVSVDGSDAGSIALPPVYQPGLPSASAGVTFETTSSDQFSMFVDNTVVWLE